MAAEALERNTLSLDLSDGLTRAEVGARDGEAEVIIGHTGGRPAVAVTLTLPGEVEVRREVADVSFRPRRITDATADLEVVELYQRNLTIEDAESELRRAVDDLGLDGVEVAAWADAARERTATEGYAPRVLRGPGVGPWAVEVRANHSPGRGVVTLHTILTHQG